MSPEWLTLLSGSPTLQFWPELGIGYYPVADAVAPYDREYFERYQRQSATAIGIALNEHRVSMVNRFTAGEVIDVGIGSGAFIQRRGYSTFGFDVNPVALKWLHWSNRYRDPYKGKVQSISLWDVLEHIHDPRPLLANVRNFVFVSMPIYTGADHVLRSKHFRKNEHCWYFTNAGLVRYMDAMGFHLVERNSGETDAGREDIGSFVFEAHHG